MIETQKEQQADFLSSQPGLKAPCTCSYDKGEKITVKLTRLVNPSIICKKVISWSRKLKSLFSPLSHGQDVSHKKPFFLSVIKRWIKTWKEPVINCLIICDRSCQMDQNVPPPKEREGSELWRCFLKPLLEQRRPLRCQLSSASTPHRASAVEAATTVWCVWVNK